MKIRYEEIGILMFDRESGLNILIDEFKVSKNEETLSPRYVSIALTNNCNLSCPHCFVDKGRNCLDFDLICKIAIILDKIDCFGIGLGGGEPLLYSDIKKLCEFIHSNTNLSISITTNGTPIHKDMSNWIETNVNFIRLSMDGINKSYEKNRGVSFSVFCEKLSIIKDCVPFGLNILINEITVNELDEVADFAMLNNSTELLILPEVNKKGEIILKEQSIDKLLCWIDKNYKHIPISISINAAELIKSPILPIQNNNLINNWAEFVHIDPKGILKKSAFNECGYKINKPEDILLGIEYLKLN